MLDKRAAEDFVGKPEFEIPPAAGKFDEFILPSSPRAENAANEENASPSISPKAKGFAQRRNAAARNDLHEFSEGLTSDNAVGIRDELKKRTPYKLTINESIAGSKCVLEFKGGVPLDKKLQAAYAEASSSNESVSLIHGKHVLHVSPDTDIANEFEEIRGLDSRRGNKPFHVEESAAGRRLVFDGKSIPKQAIKTAIEESRALHKPVELTVNGIDLGTLNGSSVVQDLKSRYDQLRKAGGSESAGKVFDKSGPKASVEKAIATVKSKQSPEPITLDQAEAAPPEADVHPAAKRNTLPSTIILPREIVLATAPAEQISVQPAETPSPASVHEESEIKRLPAEKISGEPEFDFDWGRILQPGGQQEIVTPKSLFQVQPPREMPHDLSGFFDQGEMKPVFLKEPGYNLQAALSASSALPGVFRPDLAINEGKAAVLRRGAIADGQTSAAPRKRGAATKSEVTAATPVAAPEQTVSAAPETPVPSRHIEIDPATLVVNEFKHPSGYSLVRDTKGQSHEESMMQPRYRIISDKGEPIGIFSGRLAVNKEGALHAFPRRSMIGEELTRFNALAEDLGLKKAEPGKSLSSYIEVPAQRLSGHQQLIENSLAPMMEGYDRKLNFFYPAPDEPNKLVEAQPVNNRSQELRPEEIILRARTLKSNSNAPIELVEVNEPGAKSEAGGKTKRAAGKAAAATAVVGTVLSATTQGAQALGVLK